MNAQNEPLLIGWKRPTPLLRSESIVANVFIGLAYDKANDHGFQSKVSQESHAWVQPRAVDTLEQRKARRQASHSESESFRACNKLKARAGRKHGRRRHDRDPCSCVLVRAASATLDALLFFFRNNDPDPLGWDPCCKPCATETASAASDL